MTAALPDLAPEPPWRGEPEEWTGVRGSLRLYREDGALTIVRIERCAAGRLREAYPVGEHDLEISVTSESPAEIIADALGHMVERIWEADPSCRRVVFAAQPSDPVAAAAAVISGFRHTAEVDLPGGQTVELLVSEPGWVTRVDMDLDRVPTG
jgi:hypothetical protein